MDLITFQIIIGVTKITIYTTTGTIIEEHPIAITPAEEVLVTMLSTLLVIK
jgi:hypothetical protein